MCPLEGTRHADGSQIHWENSPGAAGRQEVTRGYLARTAGQDLAPRQGLCHDQWHQACPTFPAAIVSTA